MTQVLQSAGADPYFQVKEILHLSEDQFKTLLKADGKRWKYDMVDDGWVQAHCALRYDMTVFSDVLKCLAESTQSTPLKDWQARVGPRRAAGITVKPLTRARNKSFTSGKTFSNRISQILGTRAADEAGAPAGDPP